MPAKVILTANKGPLAGNKYRFDERMLCLIGRADNCTLQITGSAAEGISRHHCLLDIQPPAATIQDLASSNGTFLNGRNIGRQPGAPDNRGLDTWQLADGDIIQVGHNFFRIALIPAVKCFVCHRVLPDDFADPESDCPAHIMCAECRAAGKKRSAAGVTGALHSVTCKYCRTRFSAAASASGEYVCPGCARRHADQFQTLKLEMPGGNQSSLLELPGYQILKRIGRGGMGAVFLARKSDSLENVALKILLPDIAADDRCREDFIREAENLKALRHPHIIELKDCDYDNGSLFIAFEYCSCGTLREYMKQLGGPLDLPLSLALLFQILDALEYAHNVRLTQYSALDGEEYEVHGLVHRDIKPDNIFLAQTSSGALVAKVADFGISKAYDMAGISGCTRTGDFSGTLGFISKQQFLNFKYAKPEVDVWAAAATFFFMLAALPPRDFLHDEITGVFEKPPLLIQTVRPDIPSPIARVLEKALDDRIQLFYKSAAAFQADMRQAVRESGLL